MIVSPNAIIHLVRFFVRCTLYTCAPSLTRTDFFLQGVEPNGQPPRIQVALATGKLVLPEQGCLGQGGCEAKPDYEGVEASGHDPVLLNID